MLYFSFSAKLTSIGWFLTGFFVYFFRDPKRAPPAHNHQFALSPADGVIQSVQPASPPDELNLSGHQWVRVSIFLSVFDVHTQKAPLSGMVEKKSYQPGRFFNAAFRKSSQWNERCSVVFTTEKTKVICVQIAGFLARRIVCDVQLYQKVDQGKGYGIICFGSRVDFYLPRSLQILAKKGQRVIGGETVIAILENDTEKNL